VITPRGETGVGPLSHEAKKIIDFLTLRLLNPTEASRWLGRTVDRMERELGTHQGQFTAEQVARTRELIGTLRELVSRLDVDEQTVAAARLCDTVGRIIET
jgi:hypothetical protein